MTIESLDITDPADYAFTPPCRYTWLVGGYLTSGTLQEYAEQWERRQYSGGEPEMTHQVITWDGDGKPAVIHPVTLTRGEMNEEYWIPYTLTVNGESAHVTVDGRA